MKWEIVAFLAALVGIGLFGVIGFMMGFTVYYDYLETRDKYRKEKKK